MIVSHKLQKREFIGEFEANRLIIWLRVNEYGPRKRVIRPGDKQTSEFKRVNKLLTLAREALALRSTDSSQGFRRALVLGQINHRLSRYKFRLGISDSLKVYWNERKPPPVDPSEAQAAVYVSKLVEIGLVDRIRSCGWCTTWFFARFKHQRFCMKECQQKAYAVTPDWRMHRRNYMREYRREHPIG
jgi:hypothetical protein